MSFFDSLLENRGLDRPLIPLWRMKVTDEEYEELKTLLADLSQSVPGPRFMRYPRECALFYAEYWRREYFDGAHSKRAVYDVLGTQDSWSQKERKAEALYEAAKVGALKLKIQIYKNESTQFLDSMFYQGGLPMRLVTLNARNSVWDRFTRGLIYRHYDFDELQIGKIATESRSMREYCDALSEALERDQFRMMPFHCKDETSPWFRALQLIAHQERTRQRKLRPFSLEWEFDVDEREGTFVVFFIASGLQRLPEEFLEDQQIVSTSFFSVQVRVNGKAADAFDYQNRFCRYTVVSKRQYHEEDVISLFLHDKQEPLLSDSLDLTIPHLLYRDKDGKYFLGNKLGLANSLILVPKGWEIIDDRIAEKNLSWECSVYRGYFIPADFEGAIVAHSLDGDISFEANTHLYWSEIASPPLHVADVIEPVYNAEDMRIALCSDGDSRPQIVRDVDIEYRSKGGSEWAMHPSYGEVLARVKGRNGEYVAPIKFLNVGDLGVRILSADKDSCSLKLSWPYGTVHCKEGVLKNDGIWRVEKFSCEDPRKIHFSLVPNGRPKAQFFLTVRAPFKDFSILDSDGNPVSGSSCIIPYEDIERFQYHLVGQGIKAYSYGDIRRELKWDSNGKLYIFEEGHVIRLIPCEGSLSTLFDSRESIRSLLDKTGKSITEASVRVQIEIDPIKRMSITIKESPYRIFQEESGRLTIQNENGSFVDYRHKLILFNLDKPSVPHVELSYSEEEGYILPEEVLSWNRILVTAKTKGRVLPALVDPNRTLSFEERRGARKASIDRLIAEIEGAKLGDETWARVIEWFYLIQTESIPPSSILELFCLSKDGNSLLSLAFQLYLKCKEDEDRDVLKDQLITIGSDLAFQWYWIRPFCENLLITFNKVIDWDSPFLKSLYVDWAISHQSDLGEIMNDISDDNVFFEKITACLTEVLGEFKAWLQELFVASILDTYGICEETILKDVAASIAGKEECLHIESFDEEFIDQNQESEDSEINDFFEHFSEPGKSRNEGWLFQRVNAMAAHLKHEIDLFKEPAAVRRSILFCRKSSPKSFLIALNNKLS